MNKIFFFDIDGTLAVHGVTPEPHLQALQMLKDKGYLTFICTGRAPVYAKKLYGDLVSGYVTCNGRYILYQGEKLHGEAFSPEELDHYTSRLEELGCGYFMVSDQRIWTKNMSPMALQFAARDYGAENLTDQKEEIPYYTFDLFYDDLEHRDRVTEALKSEVVVNDHGGHGSADCSTVSFDKGHAVAYLLKHFGIDKDHCYAFGDGYNDQAMFREAGNRIAMGNAVPEVKALATYITKSVDEGGILYALEQLLSE